MAREPNLSRSDGPEAHHYQEQRSPPAPGGSIVLGVGGGGIGRAHDNDWVLPDPLRYLSAHHARVQFRDGSYFLVDTSTNGVFVNDGTVPIGRRNHLSAAGRRSAAPR